ncbi:MAG: biotin--[acetyl-CoA-carboxylase] ligase, partial [Firmicutes bacterium]|nr:biotin--[acetyl-CoA-carboxylase] ligase [Bacillota bacterium]
MKEKILTILKTADGYVSGERISQTLNVSRAAVWKHIKKLREEGYEIDSVTNKGYRLISAPDILTRDEIASQLETKKIGRNLHYFYQIDSTNNEAKRAWESVDGSVFIAEIQTGGKGRLGRGWSSPAGTGIWMSILLKPDIKPWDASKITQAAGLAVCRALKPYGARIKWPNDIIIGTKKVCGILTEMSAETDMVDYIVCGIGINVNNESFDDEISERATSIYIESGKKHSRAEIVCGVLKEFENLYEEFLESGIKNMLDEYTSLCVNIN